MSLAPALHILLYEGAGAAPLSADERFGALSALLEKGYAVSRTSVSTVEKPAQGSLLVLGKFDTQPAATESGVRFHNLANLAPAQLGDLVETVRTETGTAQHGAWKPWFPVIDYSRCTNCMQCLSFCLFDVYGVSTAGKIQVQNNDNCKTNCPACSRVCPEVAIMFPKYTAAPINGEPVRDRKSVV